MSEWISTKDRLPTENDNYLAVVDGEVMEVTFWPDSIKNFMGLRWSTCNADGFRWLMNEVVTHWMPMPEPPEEEE